MPVTEQEEHAVPPCSASARKVDAGSSQRGETGSQGAEAGGAVSAEVGHEENEPPSSEPDEHLGTRWFLRQWCIEHGIRPGSWLERSTRWLPANPASVLMRWLDASMLVLLGVVLLVLLFQELSLFGLSKATQAQSSRVWQRLAAPFHPEQAQQQIAVVLIDEQTLQARQVGWPPQYAYYADMLRGVLLQQPRAVFVDILVEHERSHDPTLEMTRQAISAMVRDAGIPVQWAISRPAAQSLFSSADGAGQSVVGWQGHGTAYPLQVVSEHALALKGTWQADGVVHEPVDTAAMAMYRVICSGEAACPGADGLLENPSPPAMSIAWGSQLPVVEAITHSDASPQEMSCLLVKPPGLFARITESLELGWHSLRSGLSGQAEDEGRVRCPYFLTLHEEQLSELLPVDALPAGTRGPLQDKVVFIGTQLDGINDWVDSPVHKKVPGVYLHAMALDNLLNWGAGYFQQRPGLESWLQRIHGLLLAMLGGVLLLCHARFPQQARRWWFFVLSLIVALMISLLLLALFQWIFRVPQHDWIGSLMLAFAVFWFIRGHARRYHAGIAAGRLPLENPNKAEGAFQ